MGSKAYSEQRLHADDVSVRSDKIQPGVKPGVTKFYVGRGDLIVIVPPAFVMAQTTSPRWFSFDRSIEFD